MQEPWNGTNGTLNRGEAPPRRRSKIHDGWRIERIINAAAALTPMRTIAAYGGIDFASLKRWLARGRSDREAREARDDEHEAPSVYEAFLERYEQASTEGELRALAEINLAGQRGDWRAYSWLLERTRREDYGKVYQDPQQSSTVSPEQLASAILKAKQEVQLSVPKGPQDES